MIERRTDIPIGDMLDISVAQKRTFFAQLLEYDGWVSAAGSVFEVRFAEGYPKVFARVLTTHPTSDQRPGDIVFVLPYAYDEVELQDGRCFVVMHDEVVQGTLGNDLEDIAC